MSSCGHAGGLVGEKSALSAKEDKDGCKSVGKGPERGCGEEVGGKLEQVKGNVEGETTQRAGGGGWSAGAPSKG